MNVLKTVQGGNTVLKYWKEIAPFAFSSADGFHGKMKDKKWDVYKVPSFGEWKEAQKKANKKTPYEQLMLIINREDFSVTPEQMASLLEALGAKKS